jgi:hypothetical protein
MLVFMVRLPEQDMASSGSLQPVRRAEQPEGEDPEAKAPGPIPRAAGEKLDDVARTGPPLREAAEKLDNVGRTGPPPREAEEKLDNVGLVVWQSAFVLAEYLLRNPPFQQWADVRVVDLGTGTGVWLDVNSHATELHTVF